MDIMGMEAMDSLVDDKETNIESKQEKEVFYIASFLNSIAGYKIKFKEAHWLSNNLAEHRLIDEILEVIEEMQDLVAEEYFSIHGNSPAGFYKEKEIEIYQSIFLLMDLIEYLSKNSKLIDDEWLDRGVQGSIDDAIKQLNIKLYLLKMIIKNG